MKTLKMILLISLFPAMLFAQGHMLILSEKSDHSLNMHFSNDSKNESVKVTYNVFYSGDNYPVPTPFYLGKLNWFGVSPEMSTDISLNESEITQEMMPAIYSNVKNAKVWVEYSVNGKEKVKSNVLEIKSN